MNYIVLLLGLNPAQFVWRRIAVLMKLLNYAELNVKILLQLLEE